jgi:hypothetical protein
MRQASALLAVLFASASAAASFAIPGCGGDNNGAKSGGGDGSTGDDGNTGPIIGGEGGKTVLPDGRVCDNLECQQVDCPGGGKTTLSGTVYDPAGKVPLYNVIVYVPNKQPAAITPGLSGKCDTCGGTVSGTPLVTALTDAKGHFSLANVPVGSNIPLVMQIGKWRRQVTIPTVAQCIDTPITDKNLLRLPKNQNEGDLPQIAITTGGADPLECLLRKIGVSDSEFGVAGGAQRIHLYGGGGCTGGAVPGCMASGASQFASTLNGGATFGPAQPFWSDYNTLQKYDILLLACEGEANASTKPAAALSALNTFEVTGGRVFASHWHDYWFENGPAPLPASASWTDLTAPPPDPYDGVIDTSFPKGQALKDWLGNVGGLTAAGNITIKQSKHNVNSTNVDAGVQSWINIANPNTTPAGQNAVQYMTFNTPLGAAPANQCGRVVYSDLHVSSGDNIGQPFPSGCVTSDLSPQEKALEFMLFDLSSCIQSDTSQPQTPQ